MPYNLVQLERNERCGDDERDVFRPSLAEQQPCPFRQKHDPVGQQAGTQGGTGEPGAEAGSGQPKDDVIEAEVVDENK